MLATQFALRVLCQVLHLHDVLEDTLTPPLLDSHHILQLQVVHHLFEGTIEHIQELVPHLEECLLKVVDFLL